MSILLNRKDDGSLAFFLDGDLQFDSRDEYIYHEALALPALALIEARKSGEISALVLGGGDGLTARELLKSKRVSRLDLVDYSNDVLNLAANEFAPFNEDSLKDARVKIHIEDAREFAREALESGTKYDIIVSDFTAPQDIEGAQLHGIEFYGLLSGLLSEKGVLAANTVSPSGTPEAYWSIFNSMALSKLNPKPYRIYLPSFIEQGYGSDWGFILASPLEISASEVEATLTFAEPRRFLIDANHLRQMFYFPEEVLAKQKIAAPQGGSSDILVHYLYNPNPVTAEASILQDAFACDFSNMPEPQSQSYLLPAEARAALSSADFAIENREVLITQVLEMVPAVRRFQSREMIAAFLERPAAFLEAIDLPALVNQLLKRASELPRKLVDELLSLKEKLVEFAGNYDRLLELGMQALAVVCLVVVIGNLMYPDAVYAKGGHAGGGHHAGGGGHGGGGHHEGGGGGHGGGAGRGGHGGEGGRGGRGGRGGVGGRGGRGAWGGRGGGVYGGGVYGGTNVYTNRNWVNPGVNVIPGRTIVQPGPTVIQGAPNVIQRQPVHRAQPQ